MSSNRPVTDGPLASAAVASGRPAELGGFPGAPGELSGAVSAMMRAGHVPGLSLVVVDRDRVLCAGAFGHSEVITGTPARLHSRYLWFSMSKVATATTALSLADDGDLDLDAPVHEYVPYLRAPGPVQASVLDLLQHTAGLANPLPLRWVHAVDRAPRHSATELLQEVMGRRRAYRWEVGGQARYSNVGYLAAGAVIEAASGVPFEDCVRTRVLGPAAMTSTGYGVDGAEPLAAGTVHAPRVADPVLRRVLPPGVAGARSGRYLSLRPFVVDGPAYGGLIGDVVDVGRFLQLHLRDGELDGRKVLSPGAARRMRTLTRAGKPFHHGIGWFRRSTAPTADWVEHFGAGAGYWNLMRLYPERGLGIAMMANSTTEYPFEPVMDLLAGTSWS